MQETILLKQNDSKDPIEQTLLEIAQNIIAVVFGVLPLFFIPVSYIPFDYAKTIFVIVGVLLSVIFFSLSVLRSGKVSLAAPLALWGLWGVALATVVSAVLSGDMRDAFIGDDIGVHTSLFLVLLAGIATVTLLIGQTKGSIMRLYVLLTGSAVVLGVFHLLRLFFGPEMLSLGLLRDLVSTPIGGWNDLALFFGLSILVALVAFEQLPLTRSGKTLFATVIVFALIMLGVVNFYAVWIVLGLVSLVLLMYSLTKDRFAEKTMTLEGKKTSISIPSIVLTTLVFIVSLLFIIGSGPIGGMISKATGISYIEVRPSFSSTMEITRNVFKENAFVGIGPNKFVDAWRLYKDPAINETVFWATDFKGASGYLTTFFATTGILGIAAWLVFFSLFFYAGFRMLFRATREDTFWYFMGSSSFVASTYLWVMSFVYVPGATIILLAGILTSVTFAAYSVSVPSRVFSFSIASNKRAGILLVGFVMIVIVGSSSALYYTIRHYSGVHTYGKALSSAQVVGADIAQIEEDIVEAYRLSQNEAYALQLASYQLAKINALVSLPELSEEQQAEFQASVQTGIDAAMLATNQDPTDSLNWSMLGSIYSVLAAASVEGAQDKAGEAFTKARSFDPANPLYALLEAQLASRTGDLENARTKAQEAATLKRNYTDALFFLTQIDIAEGKTDNAVATTRAITSLEPNNPARHYQLGVLLAASGDIDGSIVAFNKAIELDTNYANARYFLALSLAQKGDTKGAIAQLQAVLALNPGNVEVETLIAQLQSGQPLILAPETTGQVDEPQTVSAEDDAITTTETPDTSLVSPVNIIDSEEDADVETQQQ